MVLGCLCAPQRTINICKVALKWTPEDKMKKGCVKSTQGRTVETELQALNLNIGASLVAFKGQRGIWIPLKPQITKD